MPLPRPSGEAFSLAGSTLPLILNEGTKPGIHLACELSVHVVLAIEPVTCLREDFLRHVGIETVSDNPAQPFNSKGPEEA
jgi:hypothetical protein